MLAFWSVVIPGAWQLMWVCYLGCSAFQHLHVNIFLPAFGLNATVYDKFRNVTTIHPGMVMLYLKAPFENILWDIFFYFVDTNSRTFFFFFFFFLLICLVIYTLASEHTTLLIVNNLQLRCSLWQNRHTWCLWVSRVVCVGQWRWLDGACFVLL